MTDESAEKVNENESLEFGGTRAKFQDFKITRQFKRYAAILSILLTFIAYLIGIIYTSEVQGEIPDVLTIVLLFVLIISYVFYVIGWYRLKNMDYTIEKATYYALKESINEYKNDNFDESATYIQYASKLLSDDSKALNQKHSKLFDNYSRNVKKSADSGKYVEETYQEISNIVLDILVSTVHHEKELDDAVREASMSKSQQLEVSRLADVPVRFVAGLFDSQKTKIVLVSVGIIISAYLITIYVSDQAATIALAAFSIISTYYYRQKE